MARYMGSATLASDIGLSQEGVA